MALRSATLLALLAAALSACVVVTREPIATAGVDGVGVDPKIAGVWGTAEPSSNERTTMTIERLREGGMGLVVVERDRDGGHLAATYYRLYATRIGEETWLAVEPRSHVKDGTAKDAAGDFGGGSMPIRYRVYERGERIDYHVPRLQSARRAILQGSLAGERLLSDALMITSPAEAVRAFLATLSPDDFHAAQTLTRKDE